MNSLRKAKESLLESSIYHTVILMILSLSIINDLRSSFLTFTPKNSQFLKPQNLLQLLLTSICFSPDINRKNDLILIMTPEKQNKTLELSKHWSADSTPARNEVIMKTTYPVTSVKCDKICGNY